MSPDSNVSREDRSKSGIALLGELGAVSALFILGGVGAGLLLDRAFHTQYLFLVIGVLGGFAATMFRIIRVAMKELKD